MNTKKIFKTVGIVAAVIILILVSLWYGIGIMIFTKVSQSTSPNGKYTETLLLVNGGATSGFSTIIKINGKIVLGLDGDYTQGIAIKWADDTRLQIIYRGDKNDIYKYLEKYKTVKIELLDS